MPASGFVVECTGISKRFGRLRVLDSISLQVGPGDVYLLLGQNGAGKSTLLSIIAGILRPDGGVVRISGRRGGRRSSMAGFIDAPAFYLDWSGKDNLAASCMARGIGYEGSRVNDLCASLSFDPGLLKRKVRHYSSGMRMKLALVRALNPDPDLIILDEPTNGLDPASVKDTRESIKRISLEMGKTILMTSHVIHEAKRCATRVGILKEGTIVHEGPIGPGGRAAFLRTRIECVPAAQAVLRSIGRTSLPDESRGVLRFEADQDEMPAVAASLAAAGVPIMAFGPEDDELERLFLRETGAMQ